MYCGFDVSELCSGQFEMMLTAIFFGDRLILICCYANKKVTENQLALRCTTHLVVYQNIPDGLRITIFILYAFCQLILN